MNTNGNQNKQRKSVFIASCIMIFAVIITVLLDVFDIPTRMGLRIKNVNWGFQGTIIGAVITIGLYVITYLLIQRRDLKRQRNKQEVAVLLLKDAYTDCKNGLAVFEKGYYQMLKNSDDDTAKLICSNAERFVDSSFQNETVIMDLCKDGVISSEQLRAYFRVKTFYLQYVRLSLAMPDNSGLHKKTKEMAEQEIKAALELLDKER